MLLGFQINYCFCGFICLGFSFLPYDSPLGESRDRESERKGIMEKQTISKQAYKWLDDEEKEKYEPKYFFNDPSRGINFYRLKDVVVNES